jgi:signal transduction histidine kinase
MADVSRAELKYLVERQKEEMRTLTDIGKLLNSTSDPLELIRLVAAYLKRIFPVAVCAVLVVEQRRLRVIRYASVSQVALAGIRKELAAKANEFLRQPVAADNLVEDTDDESGAVGQLGQANIAALRSSHCSRLTFNSQVIGLLSVYSGKDDAFGSEDRHVIDIVADHLGAALRNAFLLQELERAGRMKNDLLMLISHELHTPLTSIKEGTSLLLDGALGPTTPDQREFLQTVTESTGRLEMLIEKVLIATQLLTSQVRYAMADLDLAAVLRQLEAVYRPQAEGKKLTMEFAGLGQPLALRGDGPRLGLAIAQIVENAIQATKAGGLVAVRAAATPKGVEIQISDTGTGIAKSELPSIFEHFRFIGGIDDRKTGGLGLGFFITRGVIEGHHGSIRLESEPGHGTQVFLTLPKTQPAA